MSWSAVLVLAAGSYGFKAAGLLIGERLVSGAAQRAVQLLPPALFCALIGLQTFVADNTLVLDARIVGLVVAVAATLRRLPFIVIIVAAMVATALTRALAGWEPRPAR